MISITIATEVITTTTLMSTTAAATAVKINEAVMVLVETVVTADLQLKEAQLIIEARITRGLTKDATSARIKSCSSNSSSLAIAQSAKSILPPKRKLHKFCRISHNHRLRPPLSCLLLWLWLITEHRLNSNLWLQSNFLRQHSSLHCRLLLSNPPMPKRRKTLFQQQQTTLLPLYLAPLLSSNNRIQRMRLTLLHRKTIMEPFSQVDTHTEPSQ